MIDLNDLVRNRKPGWALEQPFYVHDALYALDTERVFRKKWLFAGHSCEIKTPGDYFLVEVAGDSLIVIRQQDDSISVFFNVCRHRGSLICRQSRGNAQRLVCPYHQWTYAPDGALVHHTWMPDDFDARAFGLQTAHVHVVAGLIFINLSKHVPTFEPEDDFMRLLGMQGLENGKVAYTETYDIPANWKLVIENQRECYHCPAKHKDYARIQLDTDVHDPYKADAVAVRNESAREQWRSLGVDVSMVRSDSNFNGGWWRTNRAPFRSPFVSETLDGRQVAPLMGSYPDADVGNARANTYPNFWLHASCDHVHTMRVIPVDATTTRIRTSWIVDEHAVEDQDYDVEALIAFSKLVNDEDQAIIVDQAIGVASSRYRPGPYSPIKESAVEHFVAWYTSCLSSNS